MSDKEKKIMESFQKAIPKMSDLEKEKLLSFGEGIAFVLNRREQETAAEPKVG